MFDALYTNGLFSVKIQRFIDAIGVAATITSIAKKNRRESSSATLSLILPIRISFLPLSSPILPLLLILIILPETLVTFIYPNWSLIFTEVGFSDIWNNPFSNPWPDDTLSNLTIINGRFSIPPTVLV